MNLTYRRLRVPGALRKHQPIPLVHKILFRLGWGYRYHIVMTDRDKRQRYTVGAADDFQDAASLFLRVQKEKSLHNLSLWDFQEETEWRFYDSSTVWELANDYCHICKAQGTEPCDAAFHS